MPQGWGVGHLNIDLIPFGGGGGGGGGDIDRCISTELPINGCFYLWVY